MAIITLSCDSFDHGEVVAKKVAEKLGYRNISDAILSDASRRFNISEAKLRRAIFSAPSLLEWFTSEQQKLIAFVAAEILNSFKDDNVVYNGMVGHFFARNLSPVAAKILANFKDDAILAQGLAGHSLTEDISHLCSIRVVANPEERRAAVMQRKNLNREQATAFLRKEDRDRNSWSRRFYDINDMDPSLYDLVVCMKKLRLNDAVNVICDVAQQDAFTTSQQSLQAINNLALAAGVRAALLKDYPFCEVVIARGRLVEVFIRFSIHSDATITDRIKERALNLPGVSEVSVVLIPSILFT